MTAIARIGFIAALFGIAIAQAAFGIAHAGSLRPGLTPLKDQVICSQICVKGLKLNRCEGLISKAVTTSMVQPRQHC